VSTQPVTLDMSTAQPLTPPAASSPVKLDMSTAQPIGSSNGSQSNSSQSTDDKASNTRQMLVSGLTGMPTPNMTDADKASFERGKAAGAVSVPVVAGATLGATAASEIAPSVVEKAKAVVDWAKANPIKATAVEAMAREMGIDPFQLMHKVVKYGQNLFGGSGTTK
jgi:hypothetical protein